VSCQPSLPAAVNTEQVAAGRNDAARAGSGYRYPIGLAADGGAGAGALG